LCRSVTAKKKDHYYLVVQRYCALRFILLGKGKAIRLQAWTCPEGSRKLRLPDFKTMAHEGGKVVSRKHWPPLPPGNIPVTHFS